MKGNYLGKQEWCPSTPSKGKSHKILYSHYCFLYIEELLEEMKYEKKPMNLGAANHFEYVVNIKNSIGETIERRVEKTSKLKQRSFQAR